VVNKDTKDRINKGHKTGGSQVWGSIQWRYGTSHVIWYCSDTMLKNIEGEKEMKNIEMEGEEDDIINNSLK